MAKDHDAGDRVLYGNKLSGLTRAVRMALFEKEVGYRLVYLDSDDIASGALDSVNPYRMTPTFIDGAASIFETVAILVYIDDRFVGPRLLPLAPMSKARVLAWTLISASTIYADAVTGLVTERLRTRSDKTSPDQSKIDDYTARVSRHLEILDREFSENLYFAGNSPSIVDLILAPIVHYLLQTPEGRTLVPVRRNIARWYDRITERESARLCL